MFMHPTSKRLVGHIALRSFVHFVTIFLSASYFDNYLRWTFKLGELGGLVVSALDSQAGYREFESRSGRDNFQTISTPSSYWVE